jgi:rhodanese-related sulfurtransferase
MAKRIILAILSSVHVTAALSTAENTSLLQASCASFAPLRAGKGRAFSGTEIAIFMNRLEKGVVAIRRRENQAMGETISRNELQAKIDRGDKFWLAETLEWEKFENGHLPGAVHLPPDRIAEAAPNVLPDKAGEIVVYCSSPACTASEDAARELSALGYRNVRQLRRPRPGSRPGMIVSRESKENRNDTGGRKGTGAHWRELRLRRS